MWYRYDLRMAGIELESPYLRDRFEQYKRIARSGTEQSMTLASTGFSLAELEGGLAPAIDEARRALKPEIPPLGNDGIPLRDELELELELA